MASQQIIVLENTGNGNQDIVDVAMWIAVPAGWEGFYVNPNATSRWKDAQQADLDELKAGTMREVIVQVNVPLGADIAKMQDVLQDCWTQFQKAVTQDLRFKFYGTRFDGNVWTSGGAK